MGPSSVLIDGHVYTPVVPWKLRQGGGLAELLSRTVIREEHTCSSIPLRGLTSRFYFNKIHHGCIQQGLSSTSYVLVSVQSLGCRNEQLTCLFSHGAFYLLGETDTNSINMYEVSVTGKAYGQGIRRYSACPRWRRESFLICLGGD